MTSLASLCNRKGDKCTFFNVERVEYTHPHCLLTTSSEIIIIVIKGLRTSGGNPHMYEVELLETGQQSFAEFALFSPQPNFVQNVYKQAGNININGPFTLKILARKVQSLQSSSGGIVVRCTFRHGFPDRWHTHHSVDLSLML